MAHTDSLEKAITELYKREQAFEEAAVAAAEAEHEYKVEKAKAFLKAEGTEKAREAQSVVDTERFSKEYHSKKAIREFTREKLSDAQQALSARQSLLSYSTKTNFAYSQDFTG